MIIKNKKSTQLEELLKKENVIVETIDVKEKNENDVYEVKIDSSNNIEKLK